MVSVAGMLGSLGWLAADTLLGSGRVSWEDVPGLALSSALYAVVLAPLVVLGVAWLVGRATPEVLVT